MNFLTDENIPAILVNILRENNFDVKDIKEEGLSGLKDLEIWALSKKEQRVIITYDKDFAYLFSQITDKIPGIILLRISPVQQKISANLLLKTINSEIGLKIYGNLLIISETNTVIHHPHE